MPSSYTGWQNVSGGHRRSRSTKLYVCIIRPLECVRVVVNLSLQVTWDRTLPVTVRCAGRVHIRPRIRGRRAGIQTSRTDTQVNILIWARIVLLKVCLEFVQVALVLLVVHVIFPLQMIHKRLYSVQHFFRCYAIAITLDDVADLLQVVMLVHVRERNESMTMRGCFALILGSECHAGCKSRIASHGFHIGSHAILASNCYVVLIARVRAVDVTVRTSHTHSDTKYSRKNRVHEEQVVIAAGQGVLGIARLAIEDIRQGNFADRLLPVRIINNGILRKYGRLVCSAMFGPASDRHKRCLHIPCYVLILCATKKLA